MLGLLLHVYLCLMPKVQITSHVQENYPGDLTEIFETENLIGWIHWVGDPNLVTPEALFEIIDKIKATPQIVPPFPAGSKFALALLTGPNEASKIQILGDVQIKLQREDKVVTISQNSTGPFLETDHISFVPPQKEEPLMENPSFKLHPAGDIFLSRFKRLPFFTNRKSLYLALVILIIFVSLILYQLRSRTQEVNLTLIQGLETEAQSNISSAQALGELNSNLAKSQLEASRTDFIKKVEERFGSDWQILDSNEIKRLKKTLEGFDTALTGLSRIYRIADLPIFYDTNIVKSDFKISSGALHGSKMVLLDNALGVLVLLETSNKSATIVSGDDLYKNGKFLDFSGDKIYVLGNEGVVSNKKVVVPRPEAWGDIKSLKTFAANLYLLDSGRNTIWKHAATSSAFSEARTYLGKDISVDLSKSVDMAIDGEIYVLTSSGNVGKFSGGLPQDFAIKGIDQPLKNPTAIYTDEDLKNIYILDSGNSRIVVVDKKGNYLFQYVLPADSGQRIADSIAADEQLKKIFLFSGSKIFGIDIK